MLVVSQSSTMKWLYSALFPINNTVDAIIAIFTKTILDDFIVMFEYCSLKLDFKIELEFFCTSEQLMHEGPAGDLIMDICSCVPLSNLI